MREVGVGRAVESSRRKMGTTIIEQQLGGRKEGRKGKGGRKGNLIFSDALTNLFNVK